MNAVYQAALTGNFPELRRLVDEGAGVDVRDKRDGRTPLMAACLNPKAGLEMVEFLLDHGADVHAVGTRFAKLEAPVIALAVSDQKASCEKIRLLIGRGADFNYRSPDGYTLLIWAAYGGRIDVIDLLLSVGAPVDGESTYGESALSVLSGTGHFREIRQLLDHGADPSPLGWTPLARAVALGTLQEVERALTEGGDLEAADLWERTPFLIAVHSGDPEKTAFLLARGANQRVTGRCGKPPMHYPIDRDDTRMLQWLIDRGFDSNQEDQFGHAPLVQAAENSAVGCFRLLMAAGAEWEVFADELLDRATHPEIVAMLYSCGLDLGKLEDHVLRDFIGLGTAPDLPVSKEDYLAGRSRGFGKTNPERMRMPFWNAMVRCGWSGYQAAKQFGDSSFGRNDPVWSHDRFGMSLTHLPDGRFIQIAGEHEDHYDPDFCIYNDVFIHDGKGGFEILGYPEQVFPPTDFHSATMVGPWIYIIGNLGYHGSRGTETPVYRLHVETGVIERVATRGTSPGWIHGHHARFEDGCIRISGGKLFVVDADGKSALLENTTDHVLDLQTLAWRHLEGE